MNTQVRIAIAAAAVVVVVVVVLNFLPKSGGVGTPVVTPSPTVTPSASVTASPTPASSSTAAPSPSSGLGVLDGAQTRLVTGTYLAADPFLLRATFTVPQGWEGWLAGPYAIFLDNMPQGLGVINFSIFTDVYANPCNNKLGLLNPLPGPTVDDLANALAKLPSLTATKPTAVTVGGYQGKQLTLTAPASFSGCTLSSDGAYRVWELPLGATNDMRPKERDQVWILNVGGQRLVIDTPEPVGETAGDQVQVQSVLNSIHLAPPSSGSSAGPSSTP